MQVTAFQITNFRSIVDSCWVPFSPDGITVFVGQNESGKSSVLEALHFALSGSAPNSDDFRIGAPLPEVSLRIKIGPGDVEAHFSKASELTLQALRSFLTETDDLVELVCYWSVSDEAQVEAFCEIRNERLEELRLSQQTAAVTANISDSDESLYDPPPAAAPEHSASTESAEDDLGAMLWGALPLGVLFNEETGRLPNQVDINDRGQPIGEGSIAASNFLKIADLDLPEIMKGDRRSRENVLNRANSKVSRDFNTFWSQSIGRSGGLSLKCDIDNHGVGTPGAGKPHLVFWICDGNTQLYPKQRSQGVRWFVSFYLQLKASEKAKNRRVFLLDEPGANLHSKAQGDVLKLINRLGKDTSTVIYSTHSPQMLEYSKLFRVHAVQRAGDLDDSPTQIIDAHRLGTASTDTLSPILTAMGADLSQHQVIRKTNNILLEEMSGYYYLSSFWKLLNVQIDAHFISATGVNKIQALANMFRGWGLDFIVAVDDDKQGREAYKSMKRELFGDDDARASEAMLKLPGCIGIEDIFSTEDFAHLVLGDREISITGTNADFVKNSGRSKPVLAFHFAISVDEKKIQWTSLSNATQAKVTAVVEALKQRLPQPLAVNSSTSI